MKQKKFRFLGNALACGGDEVVKWGEGVGSKCIGVNSRGYTWPWEDTYMSNTYIHGCMSYVYVWVSFQSRICTFYSSIVWTCMDWTPPVLLYRHIQCDAVNRDARIQRASPGYQTQQIYIKVPLGECWNPFVHKFIHTACEKTDWNCKDIH